MPVRHEESLLRVSSKEISLLLKKSQSKGIVSLSLVITEMQIKRSERPQLFFHSAEAKLRMKLIHSGKLSRGNYREKDWSYWLVSKILCLPWNSRYMRQYIPLSELA